MVEIELKGGGRNQFLRVSIDKPEGVTHGDCETVSRQLELEQALDAEDLINGALHAGSEFAGGGAEAVQD